MSAAVIEKSETRVFVACGRCGGQGRIAAFGHVYSGVCFQCDGKCGHWSTVEHEERLAKRREKDRERRAAKRAAEREATRQQGLAFIAEHEGLAQALEVEHHITLDLKNSALTYGSLSEAQVALALKVAEQVAEREAQPSAEVVEGRGEVTGEVRSIKWEDNDFSYSGGMVCKIVVADERGFRLYGTAPKAIVEEIEVGSRVTFTATLTAREEGFGYFKRPTSAKVL